MRDRVPYPRGTVEVSPQRSSSMTDTGTTFIRRISMSHRLVLPQTNAPVCPGLAEPSGGFARGRASTPIRTWSARAIAPPPGSPGAATDADQPHRQRVRQTSLPRHSGCRSTERPFRCVVVDHTVRPSQAVPSREGTPVRHDQHQRPARNPPSVDRPLLPAEPSTYAVSSGVSFRCRQGVSFECRLTRDPLWAHGSLPLAGLQIPSSPVYHSRPLRTLL